MSEENMDNMVEENLKNGFKQDQLLVTGIPIGEHFATPLDKIETRKKLGIKEDLFTILIMFGGGEWSGITSLFKELMKSYTEEAQIIIINGRNEDSFNKIEKLETPENINVVNVGEDDVTVTFAISFNARAISREETEPYN